ncbi:MAG TPA: antitoxin [Actinomycetota bacterium]|nr:antitoxin [Actinomycetota bacterium]
MRTTLTIDDDVLAAARSLAVSQGVSVGQAISRLARRGLTGPARVRDEGPPVFAVPPGAEVITPDAVRRALDDR